MVYAMADTKSGPLSPKTPVKEKIVGIYDEFFKVNLSKLKCESPCHFVSHVIIFFR